MADPETRTFPATSGAVTGWLGIGVCVLLLGDIALHDHTTVGLRWSLVLVLVGLLVYAFLLRPRIRVSAREVVLVNPLSDVTIPLAAVTGFEVRQVTLVFVGSRRYVGVAVGRQRRQLVRGGEPRAPGAPPGLGRLARSGSSDSAPARDLTIDLLEDRIRSGRRDAEALGHPADAEVRRTPVIWLIAAIVVAAVALAASLLV